MHGLAWQFRVQCFAKDTSTPGQKVLGIEPPTYDYAMGNPDIMISIKVLPSIPLPVLPYRFASYSSQAL